MRGISQIVSTTMLIALAFIVGVSIYYWAAGMSVQPPQDAPERYTVDASVLNATAGEISISNFDTRAVPAQTLYIAENMSQSCALPGLAPGESAVCTFGEIRGQITIYGQSIEPVALVLP